MNLGLIIGGIAGVAIIIAGVIIGPKLFNHNSTTSNNESVFTDNIKKGNVELKMTSKNRIDKYEESLIFSKNYEYFETTNDSNQFIVVDSNGKQVMPISNKKLYGSTDTFYKYLGDGYFIYNTYTDDNKKSAVLVKEGKLVLTLDSYFDGVYYILASKCAYKDGILYAGSTKGFTVAYDIKNKKELWQVDSTFIEGYSLDDDFIRVQTSVNPSGDNSSFLRDHVQTQLLITMAIK